MCGLPVLLNVRTAQERQVVSVTSSRVILVLMCTALMCFVKGFHLLSFNLDPGIIHVPQKVAGCNPWEQAASVVGMQAKREMTSIDTMVSSLSGLRF